MRRHLTVCILILLFSLPALKALFQPGFFSSHDGEHQLVRQYVFDRAVKAGHFPPRIDRQLLNHLGYPLFTFTYQLPFWLGEIFVLLGFSIPIAIKIVFILTFVASGLTMYFWLQSRWGRLAGLLGAFIYLWAPYRFATIFVRASLGEHLAFVFIPLLFWSLERFNSTRVIIGGLSFAGLLLSHTMIFQLAFIPLGLYAIFSKARHLLLIILLGLGLSAFYWLPAFYYQNSIRGLNKNFYAEHFVTLKQLVYSPWGYGFSASGPNDAMSFQIGIAQLLAVLLSLFFIQSKQIFPFMASFAVSVFLMTGTSSQLWQLAVQHGLIIDLPWRLLAITTFSSAVLAGWLVKHWRVLLIILIPLALYTNRNHLRLNERLDFDKNWFTNYIGTSNSYGEYRSTYADQRLVEAPPLPPVTLIDGQAGWVIDKDLPNRLQLTVAVTQKSQVRLNTVYFPGWQLFVNSQPQALIPILSQGVPLLDLEPGNYSLNLIYRQTPLMKIANIVSLVTSVIVILWLISLLLFPHTMPLKHSRKPLLPSLKN